jgi:hypothetical protein
MLSYPKKSQKGEETMKVLSIRKGFQSDHSSTSYEFFAIDKPLNPSERKDVARLSSRARPTRRKVSFIYHGDFSDLPGGWRTLVKRYYDVMYSESYGWWILAMAFKADLKAIKEIKKYDFSGSEDMGVTVDSEGDRVIVSISCSLSPELACDDDPSYDDYEEEEDDIDESDTIESNNELLDLLAQNREYLKNGDYRLLYGVWKEYGFDSEEDEAFEDEVPPEPPGMDKLPKPVKRLLSLLEQI